MTFSSLRRSLSEFFAVLTRAPISSLPASDALKFTRWFAGNYTVLFPDHSSLNILIELSEKYKPKGLKIHDYEIVSIGLANRVKKIATYNSKDISAIEEIEVIDLKQ